MEYITQEDLYQAYKDCCKRKRSSKGFLEYYDDWMMNNLRLWRSLNDMSYEIGQSRVFIVTSPLIREVFCAEFKDRIVHHLLIMKFGSLFESVMIDNSFSCRKGKGVMRGLQSLKEQIEEISDNFTKQTWIMKNDLKGFFMSIDRHLLWNMVRRFIKKKYNGTHTHWWLWLWKKVILNSPEKNCYYVGNPKLRIMVPKHKSLFYSNGKGEPIGNLPSQILANLLLSAFDHHAEASVEGYLRYADDFASISNSKKKLLKLLRDYKVFLWDKLRLTLHPDKIYIQEVKKGVSFIGGTVKPNRLYTNNRCVNKMFGVIKEWNNINNPTEKELRHFICRINSYFGFMRYTQSYAIRWEAWKEMKHKDLLYCKNMEVIKRFKNKKI